MLTIIEANVEEERQKLLESFDPNKMTWLVSDLDHKKELQNFYLDKNSFLEEDACLRARELWLKLVRRQAFELQIVSNDFAKIFLSTWLKKQNFSWARGQTSTATLFAYMEALLPVIYNSSAQDNLRAWLKDNPTSLMKWGEWFELSCLAWQFLQDKQLLPMNWAATALLSEIRHNWSRPMYVDVGVDLTAVEAELLKELSHTIDIVLLAPDTKWQKSYPRSLWVYNLLKGEATPPLNETPLEASEQNIICSQWDTQLVEVKKAVAQVRSWLDANIDLDQIVIYCRDPELYWPALQAHLQIEGVPVNKARVSLLSSFPQINQWVSALRSHSNDFTSEDLEAWLYSQADEVDGDEPLQYHKFRSFLSRVYDQSNLEFIPALKQKRKSSMAQDDEFSRDEFIVWSLQFFPEASNINDLEPIVSRILLECEEDLYLSLRDWFRMTETFIAKVEKIINKAQTPGLSIKKLESSLWEKAPYRIIIGLDSTQLSDRSPVSISPSEVQRIGNDLGFYLPVQDARRYELLCQLNLRQEAKELHLFCAQNSFAGDALSASTLWSRQQRESAVDTNGVVNISRWDALQQQSLEQMQLAENISTQLVLDKGGSVDRQPSSFKIEKLSASQMDRYVECPFKFFASSLLKLKDEPELILDMDRMRKGRLIHKALELLVENGILCSVNEAEAIDVIQKAAELEDIPLYKNLWDFQKQRWAKDLLRILNYEKQWRLKYPKTKILATELAFSGNYKGIEFRGKIDRVDQTESGQYVLIDYKSSGASVSSSTKWVEEKEFQLFVYTLAIENGWTELPKGECVAAVYYDLKDLNRKKGYLNKDHAQDTYELPARGAMDSQAVDQLKKDCDIALKSLIDELHSSEFAPAPKKLDICKDCEWKSLCRAPHLNN